MIVRVDIIVGCDELSEKALKIVREAVKEAEEEHNIPVIFNCYRIWDSNKERLRKNGIPLLMINGHIVSSGELPPRSLVEDMIACAASGALEPLHIPALMVLAKILA